MARKVTVTLSDDINPELEADESIAFSFEGVEYEIDLSTKNADKFRKAITPYLDAAQRVGGRKKRTSANTRTSIDREQTQAIRAWAKASGYEISDRGRIPQTIVDAYNEAP
ncbi:histone-like nucleoid-structuring protein Lsr2 [Tsukamurella tyrosinosolvens]|uniref:histone-like nucleoid-structuring protein Lsr2 n=1 Tax=Tsukamurella tyrosinosolvens TaxID=57704 RepID=UPI000C7F5B57|nr:Lsr2 family protein [Tsukamurella tyrosinosolvens]AUN41801.1 nucleoid-associated protein Lsr2 [Tsukamurella tyrosinosolvens]